MAQTVEEAKKMAARPDLNLDKLNQNQLCYRYTIGQSDHTKKWLRQLDSNQRPSG